MARTQGSNRLTEAEIRAWLRKAPASGLHDGDGLYLRPRVDCAHWSLRQVNPVTGARTWASLFPGVPYPTATLAEARRKAAEARLKAADRPTNVVQDRQAALAEARAQAQATELEAQRSITLRALFERWAATELAPKTGTDGRRVGRKDGGALALAQFEKRVFPTLGTAAAAAITKADLLSILDATRIEGRMRTANMLLTDLKQMFRFALARDLVARNPLDTVTKRDVGGTETRRDRVLSADEIAALAKAVPHANMGKRSAAAVWLILATACRVSEAMGARWEHVDLVAATWHLPETKNERPHTIHLSAFALRQFEALAALREKGEDGRPLPWVFPNVAGDGPVCVKSFGKQLADRQRPPERRMRRRSLNTSSLSLSGGRWTAHDLRRTAATIMAELGFSGDVIDECLNHVIESRVRATYIRDRRLTQQADAFDALGVRLSSLVDPSVKSNVVQLPIAA